VFSRSVSGAEDMTTLVSRLRDEIDEDVNEPLDRLLGEAADRVEALARDGVRRNVG
jgi:hypothetical protein